MATMTADEMLSIEQRFPQVFQRPLYKRFGPLFLFAGILLYPSMPCGSSACRKC